MHTPRHHEELAAVPLLLSAIAVLWVRVRAGRK
jgi:hypothetical protein